MEISELEYKIDELQFLVDRQADQITDLEYKVEEKDKLIADLRSDIAQMRKTIDNAIKDLDTCL